MYLIVVSSFICFYGEGVCRCYCFVPYNKESVLSVTQSRIGHQQPLHMAHTSTSVRVRVHVCIVSRAAAQSRLQFSFHELDVVLGVRDEALVGQLLQHHLDHRAVQVVQGA